MLRQRGSVAVSSEGELPAELEEFRLRGPVQDVHHVLAYADVFVGESGTMSTEAAVLGTPAVFVADRPAGVFEDNERRYGLLHRVPTIDPEAISAAASRVLTDGPPPGAHERLIADKLDVTAWMIEFFERRGGRRPTSGRRGCRA